MACLVTFVPTVRVEMEWGLPSISFATNDNLVGSPRAAKIFACISVFTAAELFLLDKESLNVSQLSFPATGVHFEGLGATTCRDFIKAGLFYF